MSEEKDYTISYIAFLDMLGFKELIKMSSCQHILDIFDKIFQPINHIYIVEDGKYREIDAIKYVKMKVMSDSICFYVDADVENALVCLIFCCGMFQAKLLAMKPPVLIRGGITVGGIYAEGDTLFGPGLTDAYLIEEKNAKYPRIIFTKSVMDQGNAKTEALIRETDYNFVIKDFDEFYVVNTVGFLRTLEEGDAKYIELIDHVNNVLGSTTDESIRNKYLYLKNKLVG